MSETWSAHACKPTPAAFATSPGTGNVITCQSHPFPEAISVRTLRLMPPDCLCISRSLVYAHDQKQAMQFPVV